MWRARVDSWLRSVLVGLVGSEYDCGSTSCPTAWPVSFVATTGSSRIHTFQVAPSTSLPLNVSITATASSNAANAVAYTGMPKRMSTLQLLRLALRMKKSGLTRKLGRCFSAFVS